MGEFKAIDDHRLKSAIERGRTNYAVRASRVTFDQRAGVRSVCLADGRVFSVDPRRLPGLDKATDRVLANVALDGDGAALRFSDLDIDLTLVRLVEDFVQPRDWHPTAMPAPNPA